MPVNDHPLLPGLDYATTLGRGGFADVYAYDQRFPARRVAVKVLRSSAGSGSAAAAFLAEANAMARLDHPAIVPVHSAGTTPDGRPYLVMPYYPGGSLATRLADGPLPVDEVLRIGTAVAGAVETAHRHGLLHRDIKPANILLNSYGAPGLADFGLVGSAIEEADEVGMSIPWCAPEVVFGHADPTVSSDVYALAATLWTLLAGRPPYAPGQPEVLADLGRIRAGRLEPFERTDVPHSMVALLTRGLAADPAARPASALALAQGLAEAQRELGLPASDPVVGGPDEAAGHQQPVTRASGLIRAETVGLEDTVVRAAPPDPPPGSAGRRRTLGWIVGGVVALAVLVVVAWWAVAGRPPGPVASVGAVRAGDTVAFSWTYPDPLPGDTFRVQVADLEMGTADATLAVAGPPPTCLRVQVLDAAGASRGPYSAEACA